MASSDSHKTVSTTTSSSKPETSSTTKYLKCDSAELNLDVVLLNGQSFRWKKYTNDSDALIGVACHRLWKLWRRDDNEIAYKVLEEFPQAKATDEIEKDDEQALKEYFQLDINLSTLYSEWKALDSHFKLAINRKQFEGIRVLHQPLLETIFSCICSSNNLLDFSPFDMVNTLASLYGDKVTIKVGEDGSTLKDQDFYDFPSIKQMANGLNNMEETLRKKGFGYRAKYIAKTVETLANIEGGYQKWETKVKEMEYMDAKNEIQRLDGVGPKVADCICLMSLNHHQVVPVDTHVFEITSLHYLPELSKYKNVTDAIYKKITEFYADKFGNYAGWAHTVLLYYHRFNEKVFNKKKKEFQTLQQWFDAHLSFPYPNEEETEVLATENNFSVKQIKSKLKNLRIRWKQDHPGEEQPLWRK